MQNIKNYSNSCNSSKRFYQKEPNNSNIIIKVNDIVKVSNRHYMIDSINNNAFTGTDMHGNTRNLFLNDIQSIIFDSSKQTTIEDYLSNNELEMLKNSLTDINTKLKETFRLLTSIKNLKTLKRKILIKINNIEIEKIQIDKRFNPLSLNSKQLEL
jgi:hypothetical protein